MAIKPIQILINAKDDASAVFDKLQTKIAAVGAAILGYFGIQAFAGSVKGAADLQAALSRVQAATGASAAEMKDLRAAAEGAGANTRFTAVEAAGALENLAKAGLSAKDAVATLPAVLQLAQAGDVDLATSAEFVTKAINGMGLAFTDAGRVADVLAKGANATNTSVTGLAQALSYAAPLANTLGLSLESTVAIIGKFADAGIDASRAGTALNSILAQFSDPASKFRTELAAAGITTGNFEKALHELAAAGPDGERAIAAVGQEAGPALRALVNQGLGKLDELTKSLKDAGGSAAETAKIMEANLNGSLRGLGSAWDTVKNALATPVLPVLQKGVDQLAASLRSAVADGTVAKFGQAIATGFQGAITWAKNFAASFNWDDLVARMQAFASQAQQTFDRLGQWATNAGSVVQTAWGVMTAGANTVLTAIYGIGLAFTKVAEGIVKASLGLTEALQKIAIGAARERLEREAAAMRDTLAGLQGVSEAFGKAAGESFDRAAEGARLAREGFAGLAGDAETTGKAMADTSAVIASVAVDLAKAGDAATQAGDRVARSAAQQAEGAERARQGLATLRAEYQKAIDTGNVQLAAEKLLELKKAADAAASSAKSNAQAQRDAAAEINAAFERAGIQTKKSLQGAAASALSDFQKIRDSGMATASGLGEAWKRAADAAIAATDGVAPVWVQAEAAMHGYEVSVDKAGKAVVRLREAHAEAESSANGLAGALGRVTDARERDIEARERANALKEREDALERKRLGVDRDGFSADPQGNRIAAGSELGTRTGIAAFLKSAGVDDDAAARKLANEFADSNGNVQFFNNPGQKKYNGSTLSEAVLRAAETYTFGAAGQKAQQPSSIPRPEQPALSNVTIRIDGMPDRTLRTDAEGAGVVESVLRDLVTARGSASLQ